MTNQIKIFNNPQFGDVRVTVTENNEPMFCLANVCKAVGLTNASSVKARLDKDDVQVLDLHALKLTEGNIGNTKANFITESGFYDVLLYSDAPQVRPFRKWVTSEVLPSIRKTGGYIAAKDEESPEDIMARAVLVAQATIERQAKRIAEQSKKIEEDAPKVIFADAVAGASSSCLIGELAKILTQNGYKIGQNRLFEKLRNEGYLGIKGEYYNIPNQRYQEMGLFDVKKRTINNPDGSIIVKTTTKVTGKGQSYFINKFLNR